MVSPIARPPDGRVVEPVLLKQERSRRYPNDLFGQNLEQRSLETGSNRNVSIISGGGEREYLCAEDIVVYCQSRIFHGNSHSFACASHQAGPADTYR